MVTEIKRISGNIILNTQNSNLNQNDLEKLTSLILAERKEAQKELLNNLLKAEEQIGQDKYIKSSYLRIELRGLGSQ